MENISQIPSSPSVCKVSKKEKKRKEKKRKEEINLSVRKDESKIITLMVVTG
jgi:hypothetical protein